MENNITIIVISLFILLFYNRYLLNSTLVALEERKRLTKKMSIFIEKNPKCNLEFRKILLHIHHKSMTKGLLNKFIFNRLFHNNFDLEASFKEFNFNEKEITFFKKSMIDMLKINFIYNSLLYIFYGLLLFLILIIPVLLTVISIKLIGGFKAIDKFLNKGIDDYLNPMIFFRI
jgi:hypothetical protein